MICQSMKGYPVKCEVCGEGKGREHILREMMFGLREEFVYWECSGCGALQIAEVPGDLGRYYPAGYYSFRSKFSPERRWFYKLHLKYPHLMRVIRPCIPEFAAAVAAQPKPGSRVLDVGCGSGKLVDILRSLGFDAFGIDRFLNVERPYLQKASIEQAAPGWNLIMFHHALEHMKNHAEVLRCVREKLVKRGICLVRIPVLNWAWQHYGRNWVQLDPPRHLMIHTPAGFRRLAEGAGFEVVRTIFDSTSFQFWGSDLYRADIPTSQWASQKNSTRSGWKNRKADRHAKQLNREGKGDQAVFILRAT